MQQFREVSRTRTIYSTETHTSDLHDLHLKPVSHSVAVSIQETASQLTDELPVYNSIQ